MADEMADFNAQVIDEFHANAGYHNLLANPETRGQSVSTARYGADP